MFQGESGLDTLLTTCTVIVTGAAPLWDDSQLWLHLCFLLPMQRPGGSISPSR